MLRLRRPSPQDLDDLLSSACVACLTYPEVGATRDESLPRGYRHDRYEVRLGRSDETFARARAAVGRWGAQRGAGIEVLPPNASVRDNQTLLMLARVGGLWATAPCRVVYACDEPDLFTFAYGTLPGHPEQGEEAFALRRKDTREVVFRITAFSRAVEPLGRLVPPISRGIQRRVTRRYLDAIATAASG